VAFAGKPNAVSCVLRVQDAQGRSLLITGDIEAAQEAALLRRTGAALASTMLVVPHHGSRTSSTAAFLDAVQPRAWRWCRPATAAASATRRPTCWPAMPSGGSMWCVRMVVVHGCGTMVRAHAPATCAAATGTRLRPWVVRMLLTRQGQEPLPHETFL
jgi:hypothetical protein